MEYIYFFEKKLLYYNYPNENLKLDYVEQKTFWKSLFKITEKVKPI